MVKLCWKSSVEDKMKISHLTFIVTEYCNYNCSYCWQEKAKTFMEHATIATAVDFFYPLFTDDKRVDINFYGGEPLLAYNAIEYAVNLLLEKNESGAKDLTFALTTNGSLLREEILDFLSHHHFGLMLSFDGLAQEQGRKKGTMKKMLEVIKIIPQYPGIEFEINSVFTPKTAAGLSDSLRFIIREGGKDITFNLSTVEAWTTADLHRLREELEQLTDFLVSLYRETGKVPVKNFQSFVPGAVKGGRKGIFRCTAGRERLAVTPGGNLWGCFLFHDYFKNRENHPQYSRYYFGRLTDFIRQYRDRYPGILTHYSQLRQDYFQVETERGGKVEEKSYCFLCEYVAGCVVCPVNAAYTSGSLGKIDRRTCELTRMQRNAQLNFYQKLLQSPNR
jgi:uncharacterized protein